MFVFLMCSERSGSNFITKMMNSHSQITGPSAKHIFNPVLRSYFRYGDLNCSDNWEALLKHILALFQVDFSVWKLELDLNNLKDMAPTGDLPGLLKAIYQAEANENGKEHVFIKENQIYEFFPYLQTHFSDAKFVYLTRDPRDMALSWKKNKNIPGGVVRAARQWKKDQQKFLMNAALLREVDQIYSLKYEDLIEEPDRYTGEICHFLGLEYEVGMLSFNRDILTQKNAQMNSAWANLAKGVIKDNKDKYKKYLSTTEIKVIEKICCDEMRYLGYALQTNELSSVNEELITDLEIKETKSLIYQPVVGITDNMAAKKKFYQYFIEEIK